MIIIGQNNYSHCEKVKIQNEEVNLRFPSLNLVGIPDNKFRIYQHQLVNKPTCLFGQPWA